MPVDSLRLAVPGDAEAIAALHARSWQSAYRGLLPDEFLSGPVIAERRQVWQQRFATLDPGRFCVLLTEDRGTLQGFASVLLDEDPDWGARLDNLHVDPGCKGSGLGRKLICGAARWVVEHAPDTPLHLLVYEPNRAAQGFYDAMGGTVVERRLATAPGGAGLTELRYVWREPERLASQQ